MSFEFKKLNDKISVTGQITTADIAEIGAQGFMSSNRCVVWIQ